VKSSDFGSNSYCLTYITRRQSNYILCSLYYYVHTLLTFRIKQRNAILDPEDKNSPNVAHACRKRQLKWVPSAWGYSWVTLFQGSQIWGPGPPGWGLGVGLTAPPCKNPVVRKSKEGNGP
jgi:hypothetical protein